jgi:nicotinate-nucleotide pyrophosphorylase (carboxylating)
MDNELQLQELIKNALKEDVGDGDHSTLASIDPAAEGKAILKIKDLGIVAGIDVAQKIFLFVQPDARFYPHKKDGDKMEFGETAFTVEGKIHMILKCERLVLNCMQRMSGIATLTRKYVDKLKKYHTRLLDTRKTTPNFRLLEKRPLELEAA